jgi:hypothetical protein
MAPDRSAEGVRSAVMSLDAPISPGASAAVFRQVERLLSAGVHLEIICDVSGRPDLGLIDVLAQLALLTQRSGACLRIRPVGNTSEHLAELIALTGLECLGHRRIEALAVKRLEPRRQAETRE